MKTKTCILTILLVAGLTSSRAQDTWTQKTDFGGVAREGATGFSIGSKGYIGLGAEYPISYKDFWEYDPDANTWTQKADFGGHGRLYAVGFTIAGKGYVGTGQSGSFPNYTYYKDFWEYDPNSNTWTRKANFGGAARYGAAGFSIDGKGYLGTGVDASRIDKKDFWEFDPIQNTWVQKADFGGVERKWGTGFAIGVKGYVGLGGHDVTYKDFWEYDPTTDMWMQRADFGGSARVVPVSFSIGNKGYIGTGENENTTTLKDFWEFDPTINTWTQRADFGGTGRNQAAGFSIGSKGYIGNGVNPSGYEKDFWEYTPDSGGGGLTLTSVASRRTQGGQTFDINLPLSGTSGVEPRSGANEFIIFTFSNNVTAVDSTTSSCGTIVSTTIDNSDAHNVIVQSNGACNQQDVVVTLSGVHDDQGNTLTSAVVTVGVLYGDVNGDRRITRADQDQIKAHRGQTVDGSNFLSDINCSGVIDANDLFAVRRQRGNRLP